MNVGIKIRNLRKSFGYNQEIVARQLGKSRVTITNIENNRQSISIEDLLRLCRFFKITPNDFLDWK